MCLVCVCAVVCMCVCLVYVCVVVCMWVCAWCMYVYICMCCCVYACVCLVYVCMSAYLVSCVCHVLCVFLAGLTQLWQPSLANYTGLPEFSLSGWDCDHRRPVPELWGQKGQGVGPALPRACYSSLVRQVRCLRTAGVEFSRCQAEAWASGTMGQALSTRPLSPGRPGPPCRAFWESQQGTGVVGIPGYKGLHPPADGGVPGLREILPEQAAL